MGGRVNCTQNAPAASAGSDKQLIFNDGGSTLAGAATLYWDKTASRLSVNAGTTPTEALDVTGKVTADAFKAKGVTGAAAPISGSSYWASNGTNIWRATGNVGIGTANPSNKLDVVGNTNAALGVLITNSNTGSTAQAILSLKNDSANGNDLLNIGFGGTGYSAPWTNQPYIWTGSANGLYINSTKVTMTGNVGIGTTNPQARLDINHAGSVTAGAIRIGDASTISSNTGIYGRTSGAFTLGAAGGDIVLDTNDGSAERLRIQHSTGNVGIGTANPSSAKLQVNGTIIASLGPNPAGNTMCYATSTNVFGYCSSDVRLKTDIAPITNHMLDVVMQLRPVTFKWIDKDNKGNKTYAGFIAQEVAKVIPLAARLNPDGMYGLDSTAIEAHIVGAIQELKAANDNQASELRAELKALSEEFRAYKAAHP